MADDKITGSNMTEEDVSVETARRQKRRKRGLWLRILRGTGWTLLSLAVAVVIICSAVVWVLSPEQLTPIIERVASRSIDADVRLRRAELTFWSSFPKIKIEIDGLDIVSRSLSGLPEVERAMLPADADSLMSVGHFSGGVNLVNALAGKISVYDVELERPRINLIQVNDTVSNFNIFPSSPSDTTSSTLPEITINHFAITDALPMRYRSLPDSVDVTVNLSTISLDSDGAPEYRLEMDTRIETPLLHDVSYETARFSLDGNINWSAKTPSQFNINNLRFRLEDDIDLTLSTSVDVSDNLRFDRLEMALSNLRPADLTKHLPLSMREEFESLDTDMAVNVSAKLTRPFVITDSITIPWVEATVNIPDCRFGFQTIDFRHLSADIKAEVNGDDLNRSTVTVERLLIDGKALDIDLTATVTSLLDNPLVKGKFHGAIDFSQLPAVVKRNLGGRLTGRFDADTKFNFRLSDFSARDFHKANIDGEVNLRDIRYSSSDTTMTVYTHRAKLTLGTDMTLRRDDKRIDSLLMVKVDIDTASMMLDGIDTRIKGFKAGFGASNVASSTDTTQINPFGGAVHLADFYCYSPEDSMRVRVRDVGGFASLQRYNGEARVPRLELRLSAGRMRVAQPMYMAALRGAKVDVTAHLRPRRQGKSRRTLNMETGTEALRRLSERDTLRESMQSRMLRLAAEQLDSAGTEMIDFNIDNSVRSLLQRWSIHGTMQAERGNLRLPHLRLRNGFDNLDFTFSSDSVELRNLNYRFGHSDFRVNGLISNIRQALSTRRPGPVKINFDILSDSINVNEIVRGIAGAETMAATDRTTLDEWSQDELADIENPESIPDSIMGPILIPVNIDATLDVHARKVIYSDLLLDDFAGELLINRGMVNLHNLSAKTEVGNINVSALYSAPKADDITFGMAMDLRNFHIARLPQVVPAIDSIMPMMHYLSGVVNAQIAVTSDITPDMYFDLPSLKAAMQFSGDSLVVFDNDTFRSLAKWLIFKDKKRNMIDRLNVEMTVSDGVLNLYPFIVNIDRYKLGIMGYNDLDFNLHYHIAVLKSPIPFKFGINIKGEPDHLKFRLGGAKFKENMVAQRDSIAVNTRISLLSEINGAFRRGLRAARLGPLRIKGAADSSYMHLPEERFTAADSALMIKEGLIEVPDSVAADIISRTTSNTVKDNDSKR